MRLDDLADRLDALGDLLAATSTTMSLADPGARAFGGDAPGAFGELGRAFYRRWAGALASRGREAAAHGARLADTAQAVRLIGREYREVDQEAADRHQAGGR